MSDENLRRSRREMRDELIAARRALSPATCHEWRARIDAHLEAGIPGLASGVLGIYWPIRNEYDPRHLGRRLRARGTVTALPVVLGRGVPLVFREWAPGVRLAPGALGIPYPEDTPERHPDRVLVPMNGWDLQGYRLGYGGGFFDRTLAAPGPRPIAVGIAYECARVDSIDPQPWDVPMDYVVTERGLYRRAGGGLMYLGASLAVPADRSCDAPGMAPC